MHLFYSFVVIVSVWLVDAIVKYWVCQSLLNASHKIEVLRNFMGIDVFITCAINTGAAWNFMEQMPYVLLVLRIILVAILFAYLLRSTLTTASRMSLAAILGGAIGNITDCFVYGHVIDMFQVVFWGHSFPVFNVADSAITLGAFGLILLSMQERKKVSL